MNRESFEPYPGRIYTNHGGGRFLCIGGGEEKFFFSNEEYRFRVDA